MFSTEKSNKKMINNLILHMTKEDWNSIFHIPSYRENGQKTFYAQKWIALIIGQSCQ